MWIVLIKSQGLETWRLHAEVVGMTTHMGLHTCLQALNDRSVLVQVKRRMYAGVYMIDKVLAMFTGRPPLLGRRYATVPLPLDMSDEELLGDIPPSEVDPNGWSTEGRLLVSTMLRARTMLAQVAEGILEIALQSVHAHLKQQLL